MSKGQASTRTCDDWTSEEEGENGGGGFPHYAGNYGWTQRFAGQCSAERNIYCLGIDYENPLPKQNASGRAAFVSKAFFQPDGGLAGADEICQEEADEAGLQGNFKALLATSTQSAISRFSLAGPTWVRTDGLPLWDTAEDAEDPSFLLPLVTDAEGDPADLGVQRVWLGATGLDVVGTHTCDDWSSLEATGRTRAPYDVRHNQGWNDPCTLETAHVVCLEE